MPTIRNIGIKYNKYKFIGFLDDDCLPIKSDLLKRAYIWLSAKHKNIIGVGGPVYIRSNKPTQLSLNHFQNLLNFNIILQLIKNKLFYNKTKLSYVSYLAGGNCFFKKILLLIVAALIQNLIAIIIKKMLTFV